MIPKTQKSSSLGWQGSLVEIQSNRVCYGAIVDDGLLDGVGCKDRGNNQQLNARKHELQQAHHTLALVQQYLWIHTKISGALMLQHFWINATCGWEIRVPRMSAECSQDKPNTAYIGCYWCWAVGLRRWNFIPTMPDQRIAYRAQAEASYANPSA